MSYILFDEKLLATIRTEISPAFKGATVDYNHIYDNCPRLAAVFKESLRVIFGSVSARQVVAPTVMGTKTLQTGKPVLLVTRHMHSGEEAFGKNADKFEAERFLDNSLDRSKDYKPFGSGATYCPGRVLAKREVLVFVAIMLHRFDIELLDKDGMAKLSPPELDEVVPTLGIKPPVKGTEVYVRLREASRTTEYNE